MLDPRLGHFANRLHLVSNLSKTPTHLFHLEIGLTTLSELRKRFTGVHRFLVFVNRFLGVHDNSYVVTTVTFPTDVMATR